MLNNTQKKVFNITIDEIEKNTNLKGLTQNTAFRKFLLLQSVLYEKYQTAVQDEMLADEKRLRAAECLKLVESTFNFFSEFKDDDETTQE